MSVNKVFLVGHLGNDPEVKYLPSGSAVANFSLATNENYTDKTGQKVEKTEWYRIVVFGKAAENCAQYLKKGSQAFIEGKLQTRSWEDKQSGGKRYATEVIALNVQFLSRANTAAKSNGDAEPDWTSPSETPAAVGANEDLPF